MYGGVGCRMCSCVVAPHQQSRLVCIFEAAFTWGYVKRKAATGEVGGVGVSLLTKS
jgi:hypothetical protein